MLGRRQFDHFQPNAVRLHINSRLIPDIALIRKDCLDRVTCGNLDLSGQRRDLGAVLSVSQGDQHGQQLASMPTAGRLRLL